jgi:hypothetical protein
METEQIMEMLKAMRAKAEANREVLKGIIDANKKFMRKDIKSSQAEMRSILDTWITDKRDARKKTTACQEVTGANPEKIEPNSGEEEALVKQQEIYNEEVPGHSLRACRKETAASQEATETEPDP